VKTAKRLGMYKSKLFVAARGSMTAVCTSARHGLGAQQEG